MATVKLHDLKKYTGSNSTNCYGGPFKFPKLNLGFFYSCIILPKLNLGFFLQLFQLNQLLSAVLPINSITTVSRWESSLLAGPDVRFRHYLNHLFQTHKLYLILLKNRLINSVALLGKEYSISIVSVDFKIM